MKRRKSRLISDEKSADEVLGEQSVTAAVLRAIFYIVYGEDYVAFNTVADTSFCCTFFLMQLTRLMIFIGLCGLSLVYFYIYFSHTVFLLNFWSLLFTTLAFGILFVGSGMEMVYQKKLERSDCQKKYGGLKYSNLSQRPVSWIWGVAIYA